MLKTLAGEDTPEARGMPQVVLANSHRCVWSDENGGGREHTELISMRQSARATAVQTVWKAIQADLLRQPNKRMHPTPLRVERDRRNFDSQNWLDGVPILSVRRG